YGDPESAQRLLQRLELRPQRRLDPIARFVTAPEIIAEGLDHVVRGNAEMRRSRLEHLQDRRQHTRDRSERPVRALGEAPQTVEMPEQLVGAIDEIDDHLCIGYLPNMSRSTAPAIPPATPVSMFCDPRPAR